MLLARDFLRYSGAVVAAEPHLHRGGNNTTVPGRNYFEVAYFVTVARNPSSGHRVVLYDTTVIKRIDLHSYRITVDSYQKP
jgi:copper(I)-binding protein